MSDSVWLLMVFNVPDRLGGLLARLRFRATKKNRAHWWRIFDPDKEAAEKVKAKLVAAGLHGKWKPVPRIAGQKSKPVRRLKRYGKPERQSKAPQHPDAAVTSVLIAQENRLGRDALKRAIERRRQAETAAQREVYRRADDALKRAKGE